MDIVWSFVRSFAIKKFATLTLLFEHTYHLLTSLLVELRCASLKHSKSMYPVMCYTCTSYHCKFISTNDDDFLEHLVRHISTQKKYNCDIQFESYDNLFNHIKESYVKIEFECVYCATFFISKSQFDDHKCDKTVDLSEMSMSMSEWREMEYILERNIEN